MNFEEIYEKYKAGTATDEEKAFVEAEIEKAKKISSMLDEQPSEPVVEQADDETYKKAKKTFSRKTTLKVVIIVVCCIAIIGALVGGTVLGVSYYSASDAEELTEEQAIQAAKQCVADAYGEDVEGLVHTDVEKELEMDRKLTKSIYVYEIEIKSTTCEYEVEVNAQSGFAHITDVECKGEKHKNPNSNSGGNKGNNKNANTNRNNRDDKYNEEDDD